MSNTPSVSPTCTSSSHTNRVNSYSGPPYIPICGQHSRVGCGIYDQHAVVRSYITGSVRLVRFL